VIVAAVHVLVFRKRNRKLGDIPGSEQYVRGASHRNTTVSRCLTERGVGGMSTGKKGGVLIRMQPKMGPNLAYRRKGAAGRDISSCKLPASGLPTRSKIDDFDFQNA